MAKCIYNNNSTHITVYDDHFTIGKKKIMYSDVYSINKDNLTNYLGLFNKNLYTFLFLSLNLVFFLFFKYFDTFFILVSNFILLIIVYYLKNFYFPRMFKDEIFVLYDIVYKTHHDTLLVSLADGVEFNKKKLPKLKYMESRYLQRYIHRIKQGRKYLFSQIETNNSAGEILYEKYLTVAQIRYKDTKAFDRRVVSHIEKAINENFVQIRRYTLYMFRCNVIMMISTILYFVSTWERFIIGG